MELQLVQNEQFKVRKTEHQGETWFVARDVTEILGYKNIRKALMDHVEDDDRMSAQVDTAKGTRSTVLINEIGVYSMVLGSKLQAAKEGYQMKVLQILQFLVLMAEKIMFWKQANAKASNVDKKEEADHAK